MSIYNRDDIASDTYPLVTTMSKFRPNSRHTPINNLALLRRYLCISTCSCLISAIVFSTILYYNMNHVLTLYSNTFSPMPIDRPSSVKIAFSHRMRNDRKITDGLTIHDRKITYQDFNYLNSETLTYDNRIYENKIRILFRMPKKRNITSLLLIFHGCSRSAYEWFHTIERQRIIGAAIDLGYGCLVFQATDNETSCWSSNQDLNDNEDARMVIKGLEHFYKEFPQLESLPRFIFGSSSGGMFSSVFVTNQRYKIHGQILFISIILPFLSDTQIKKDIYPPTAWIHMPRDIEFASEARINESIKILLEQKIPYKTFPIKPISLTQETFHQRIPNITKQTSQYIFFRFQQNQWLNEEHQFQYNPRRVDTWKTFLFTPNSNKPDMLKITKNLQENEKIIPEFLNTIYGEHEISFQRSYEALKWHLCIYNNKTNCIL